MKVHFDFIKKIDKRVAIGFVVVGLILCVLTLVINKHSDKRAEKGEAKVKSRLPIANSKQPDVFKQSINDSLLVINKRLARVQQQMDANDGKNKDWDVYQTLGELDQTVKVFKQKAESSLIKSHEENEGLSKKIEALQGVIASLKGKKDKTQYLDKKALPFEVLAIDSVNEEAVLALRYHFNHVALEAGDRLAGWKVLNVDYAHQRVEFDDEKGTHVALSLSLDNKEKSSWA